MAVNKFNGVAITTSSKINNITASKINGQAITAGGGGGSPALIATTGASTTLNAATTSAIDTSGSNLLIINTAWYSAGAADVTVSDSKSNTWTALTTAGPSALVSNRIYYCFGGTVGSGHTFTVTGASSYPSLQVAAFSNATTGPLDQQTGSTTAGSWTTKQPGSITPSQANTIAVVGLSFEANSGGTISINDSYTIATTVAHNNGVSEGGSLAYKILSAATAQNPEWTTSSSSTDGATTIASFKY